MLSREGYEDWLALKDSRLLAAAQSAGTLVATTDASIPDAAPRGDWVHALEHEAIPFISYPYEWPFSMLKDAALLQLDLLQSALEEDLILKDASPYNVQWRGARPVFIDIGSFERLRAGEPWAGYRQFCSLFLFPLMLRAYKGVPYRTWLRGDLEGISPQEMRSLMSRRDLLRPGVALHVALQAKADARYSAGDENVREQVRAAGFSKDLILANARRLRKLVDSLSWRAASSEWSEYATGCAHVEGDRNVKERFVRQVLATRRWPLVWDLGANDGYYSRLAASHADAVLAIDGDELVLDRLYRSLSGEAKDRITPLVIDLANPSPAQGWAGRERMTLEQRGRPALTLMLAVIHHLSIGRNIPVADVVRWLAELGGEAVLEFPQPDDPMVLRLRRNKRDEEIHPDYSERALRGLLAEHFDIQAEERTSSGHRLLLHLTPRS